MFKVGMKVLNRMVLSSLIILTSVYSNAGGGFVNNGGGLAEKNVLYAYEKIEDYIRICLQSEVCKLAYVQKSILLKIYEGLPEEKKSQQILFGSEQKAPGSFMIDGNVRVARTGSTIGSPIYINTDLLYAKGDSGTYEATTIPEAVAILVHEFGHHYGNFSHEELDLIGVRVSLMMQQKFISTPLVPWAPNEISASVFNPDLLTSFPQVLLNVGGDVVDISKTYVNSVHCEVFTLPIPILPIPDLELITKTPVGSLFHNVHWEKIKDKGDYYSVKITGNVSNNCKYKKNIGIRNNNYQLSISFKVNKLKDGWKIDARSIILDQFKDPWWKILKLPN